MTRTFSKEQVIAAYQNSPDLVREAFNSEKTVAAIRDIRNEYNLHVDTSGTLGENVGYMLIGLLSPSEFFGEMVLSGVEQSKAKGILEALNTRIFIPLRNKIINPGQDTLPRNSNISYSKKEEARVRPHKETLPPPSIVIASNTAEAKVAQKPSFNLIPSSDEEQGAIRTMAKDIASLKETDSASSLIHTVQERHTTPAMSFQTASIPISSLQKVAQPVNVKVEAISIPILDSSKVTGPKNVDQQFEQVTLPSALSKDPYRESV